MIFNRIKSQTTEQNKKYNKLITRLKCLLKEGLIWRHFILIVINGSKNNFFTTTRIVSQKLYIGKKNSFYLCYVIVLISATLIFLVTLFPLKNKNERKNVVLNWNKIKKKCQEAEREKGRSRTELYGCFIHFYILNAFRC